MVSSIDSSSRKISHVTNSRSQPVETSFRNPVPWSTQKNSDLSKNRFRTLITEIEMVLKKSSFAINFWGTGLVHRVWFQSLGFSLLQSSFRNHFCDIKFHNQSLKSRGFPATSLDISYCFTGHVNGAGFSKVLK